MLFSILSIMISHIVDYIWSILLFFLIYRLWENQL